jgi:hypothetical protein
MPRESLSSPNLSTTPNVLSLIEDFSSPADQLLGYISGFFRRKIPLVILSMVFPVGRQLSAIMERN